MPERNPRCADHADQNDEHVHERHTFNLRNASAELGLQAGLSVEEDMQILTSAEMAAVDTRTSAEFGVSRSSLMDRAGRSVAEFCLRQYPAARHATVLCGRGNNGGDGLVAARVLAESGLTVRILLLANAEDLAGEAAGALQTLQSAPTPVFPVLLFELPDEQALARLDAPLGPAEILLDAIVGTGFKPPLRGTAVTLRTLIEESGLPTIAVDLPSGWDADSTAETVEGAFPADAVVTFTAPKYAHVFGHLTRSAFGPVVIAPIGSPPEAVVSASGMRWAGSSKAVAEAPRAVNSNKGKFGHVLVVGGSYGTAGAAGMASLAALRTGAGLVTAAVPESLLDLVAHIAPELMLAPLHQGPEGAVSLDNLHSKAWSNIARTMSVIALGPGLSTRGEASKFARELVARTTVPMVIDADALNAFDGRTSSLDGRGRVMVLTPHPGEMARLLGLTVAEVEADRIGLARSFATTFQVTLVLKGWRTLIAHPDGSLAVNTTGNPSMAKGGSGDILTGIIAAMLAQYAPAHLLGAIAPADVAQAVEAAVFLHGLAGDFAAHAMDEHTVLATDTVTHLSDAFRYRVTDRAGLTWLCGLNRDGAAR